MEDPSFGTLSSQRVTIRRFKAEDAEALTAYRSDPDVARYQAWEVPYPLDKARRLIESLEGAIPGTPGSWFQFAVAVNTTGLLIGDCGLRPTRRDPSRAELGFTFARAYQGKGYASEAVRCLLEYAFTSLALQRVFAITQTQNDAARRLLERLGFRGHGHFVEDATVKGDTDGELIFERLQEDWKHQHAPNNSMEQTPAVAAKWELMASADQPTNANPAAGELLR
jgi:RimJ/RimL family protein N-acetyltransferase